MWHYPSCWWLQETIEFSYLGSVHACCYGYPRAKKDSRDRAGAAVEFEEVGHVYLCDVKDNRFPSEEIRRKKASLHALIAQQDEKAAVCLECPTLKTQDWSEQRYLCTHITLNTWLHCNLKCTYCFVAHPDFKAHRVAYDQHAVFSDMLNGGFLDPKGSVTWGGGDISALPEFNEVSQLFVDYGVMQTFKTSGYKFLRSVASALDKKIGLVEVSVDAGTSKTYAKVKGKDVYASIVDNLIRYSECGDIQLKYVATTENLGDADIDGFLELVGKLNTKAVIFTPEWTACHSGAYQDHHLRSLARLINSTRSIAPNVVPNDRAMGERLFPSGMWKRLEPFLEVATSPIS